MVASLAMALGAALMAFLILSSCVFGCALDVAFWAAKTGVESRRPTAAHTAIRLSGFIGPSRAVWVSIPKVNLREAPKHTPAALTLQAAASAGLPSCPEAKGT